MELKEQLGKNYKKLRESKRFLLKEAAGDDISYSQLSAFENGKAMIGVDRFFAILNNINVSSIEFQGALEKELDTQDSLLLDLGKNKAYMSGYISKLKHILKGLVEESVRTGETKRLRLEKVATKAAIFRLDNRQQVPEKDVQFLKNYLLEIKEWGRYEIRLFGNCDDLFDSEDLQKLVHKMISPMQANHEFYYIQHLVIRTLVNIVATFVNRGDFDLARQVIHYLEKSEIHEYYLFEKLTLAYAKACLDFKETGRLAALDLMKKIKDDLIFYGCYKTADMAEREIHDLET